MKTINWKKKYSSKQNNADSLPTSKEIILVHSSSRATSRLFANKQINSLKNQQVQSIQAKYTLAPCKNTSLHLARILHTV